MTLKNVKPIEIDSKEDLLRYIPELDIQRFRRKGHGNYHGPCPVCGGRDRYHISNGFARCTHDPAHSRPLERNVVVSEDDIEEARRKAEEERLRDIKERNRLINELTESRLWVTYHHNLLATQDRLDAFMQESGISIDTILHWEIGFNPAFKFNYDGQLKVEPAYTFPILRSWQNGKVCLNIRGRILADYIEGDKYRPIWTGLGVSFLLCDFWPQDRRIFILEGEKKAYRSWQDGLPALAIPGVDAFRDAWVEWIMARYDERYVVFDMDNKFVRKSAARLAEKVGGKILTLGGKIDDLLNAGQITVPEIFKRAKEAK